MPQENSYVMYLRKSTRAEDRQIASIQSQKAELKILARTNSLRAGRTIAESRSASKPGRPGFAELLRLVESGEVNSILTWKLNRLARNFDDGGKIISLLQAGKIREIRTPAKTYLPTDNAVVLAIELGMANQYARDLSEDTKRGLRSKVERGEMPGAAPLGYRNVRHGKRKKIAIDPRRGPAVKEAFTLYATGEYTTGQISEHLATRGVLSQRRWGFSGGKPLGLDRISKILTNPFYYGHFRYAGELREGSHEPLITKALFDEVQVQLSKRWPNAPRRLIVPKAFLGLLHCGECGCSVTAERQKGHIYYRCTKKNPRRNCAQPYVREEDLTSEILGVLSPFVLQSEIIDELRAMHTRDEAESIKNSANRIKPLEQQLERLDSALEDLLDMRLDGEIDANLFARKKATLLGEKKRCEEDLATEIAGNGNTRLEPLQKWLLTAQNLGETLASGSPNAIAHVSRKIFGSNLLLFGKRVRGEAVEPWTLFAVNELSHDAVRDAGIEPAPDAWEAPVLPLN